MRSATAAARAERYRQEWGDLYARAGRAITLGRVLAEELGGWTPELLADVRQLADIYYRCRTQLYDVSWLPEDPLLDGPGLRLVGFDRVPE